MLTVLSVEETYRGRLQSACANLFAHLLHWFLWPYSKILYDGGKHYAERKMDSVRRNPQPSAGVWQTFPCTAKTKASQCAAYPMDFMNTYEDSSILSFNRWSFKRVLSYSLEWLIQFQASAQGFYPPLLKNLICKQNVYYAETDWVGRYVFSVPTTFNRFSKHLLPILNRTLVVTLLLATHSYRVPEY